MALNTSKTVTYRFIVAFVAGCLGLFLTTILAVIPGYLYHYTMPGSAWLALQIGAMIMLIWAGVIGAAVSAADEVLGPQMYLEGFWGTHWIVGTFMLGCLGTTAWSVGLWIDSRDEFSYTALVIGVISLFVAYVTFYWAAVYIDRVRRVKRLVLNQG